MTDSEIIKGLECCADYHVGACLRCPYEGEKEKNIVFCVGLVRRDALDLIKRQAAEIEKLRTDNAIISDVYIKALEAFEAEKAEKEKILKEFESKQGEWIEKDDGFGGVYYDCTACGCSWTTVDGTPWENNMRYCPECGAKMKYTEAQK